MLVTVDVTNEYLADLAAEVARQHAARTPERRAAAALWTALITTSSIDAARRALATFTSPLTQTDAEQLLGRLAKEHACQP